MTATSEAGVHGGPLAALGRPAVPLVVRCTGDFGLRADDADGGNGLAGAAVGTATGSNSPCCPRQGSDRRCCSGVWAGSLVDHHDRRSAADLHAGAARRAQPGAVPLIATGAAELLALLLVITLASGTVNAVDGPARQIYVLDLVGDERMAGAVGLYEVILNLSRVLGPALGGVLLAISGPAACVLVNALTFAAPLAVLLRFRPQSGPAHKAAPSGRGPPSST